MLKHEEEIFSRPARTWFQSSKDKTKAEGRFLSIQASPAHIRQNAAESNMKPGLMKPKKPNLLAIQQRRWVVPMTIACLYEILPQPKRDKFSGLSRKVKRRKLAQEQDAELKDAGTINASIRGAKKAQRPTKIGIPEARRMKKTKNTKDSNKRQGPKVGKGLGFDADAGAREGMRARKGDAIGGRKLHKKGTVTNKNR
jgi:ATP-dependent RNA helicase DDX27